MLKALSPPRRTAMAAIVAGFLSYAQLAAAQPALLEPQEQGAPGRLLLAQQEQERAQQPESSTPDAAADNPPLPEEPRDLASAPLGTVLATGAPVAIGASIALRYEYSTTSDLTDQLRRDVTAYELQYRARLGAGFGALDDVLSGGIRVSTWQAPNPAVGFSPLGDAFRPKNIGFDQWWVTVRPFTDRRFLSFIFGKMPNPIWRGDVGTWRSEMIWDNDINPSGLALRVRPIKSPHFTLDNLLAYYQLNEIENLRFIGKTGVTSLIVDQVTARTRWATAALAFYDYENLNAGLSSPENAANAFLLRPGLFMTNNRVNYGPGAEGFVTDAFRMLNATVQVRIPIKAPDIGDPDLFLAADYIHNFKVSQDRDGIRGTIGVRMGDEQKGLQPLNLWVTYGYVAADAVLATFADSELGAGSGYSGVQAGVNYQFVRHLRGQLLFNHYAGTPRRENVVQRMFVELVGDF